MSLAYLRAFIIVLVVAQHAAMPYHVILPEFVASSLPGYLGSIQAISPVNDPLRSGMLWLLVGFNDSFFMALLFLLSGSFVWRSVAKKDTTGYLRGRLLRLGVPLLVMILLRPLTYFPTYLQKGGRGGRVDFWAQWSAVPWRGGPSAAISFAFLAGFLRFARTRRRVFDSFFENSYGVYVIHYGVSAWMSYALLRAPLPAAARWAIAFSATLAVCWAATAAARRVPGVARVL